MRRGLAIPALFLALVLLPLVGAPRAALAGPPAEPPPKTEPSPPAAPAPEGPSRADSAGTNAPAASTAPAGSPLGPVAWATDARGTVTLAEVLDHARKNAPALLVVRGRLSIGEADLEAAKPIFIQDPFLWAGLGARFTRGERTTFEMQSQIYQQIEVAGERRMRIEAAKRLKDYTQADVERVEWEVEVRVREAFREAVVARLKLDTARRQRDFNDRLLDLVGRQLEEGDIAPLDFRLAEVQAMQARQAEISAENAYNLACRRVAVLSGWTESFEPKSPLEAARPVPAGADLLALAEKNQRELKTLEAQVSRAAAMGRLAKRNVVPEPQLGLYYGREVDPFARVGMNVVLGTIGFTIPAAQRNRREIAYAKADLNVAKSERDAFRAQLPGVIGAAKDRVDATAKQVAMYEESIVPNLESNVDLLQKGYDLGELTVFEVSIARERFFSIQQAVLDAHGDYYRAVADLESALGASPFPTLDDARGPRERPAPSPRRPRGRREHRGSANLRESRAGRGAILC
jgi:cobalt-zinc-cadmium efflux system outer membrane protein